MKSAATITASAQPRHCSLRTPSGRFCRLPIADRDTGLCYRHAFDHKKQTSADFLQRLTTDCDEFTTAMGIHNSLHELYKLLAADLITARRAAVLAYIANLLLRTIPIVHSEIDSGSSNQTVRVDVDFDMPRPHREDPKEVATEGSKELSTSAASNARDSKE